MKKIRNPLRRIHLVYSEKLYTFGQFNHSVFVVYNYFRVLGQSAQFNQDEAIW